MTRERLVVVGERSIKRIGNGPGALYADLTAYRECDRDVTGQSVEELSEFPRQTLRQCVRPKRPSPGQLWPVATTSDRRRPRRRWAQPVGDSVACFPTADRSVRGRSRASLGTDRSPGNTQRSSGGLAGH